ncbi:MAG: SMC-Scp complex subunit ScpB [Gemmataceae bacterium]
MSDESFTPDDTPPPPLARIVEALLFVGGAPLSHPRAAEAVRGLTAEQPAGRSPSRTASTRSKAGRTASSLREEGYEMALRPALRQVRERLYGTRREARLSSPALDALALVAYRQPVTRQEVDALRGSDSVALLRQLVRLGLIAVQRGDAGRQEVMYGTTSRFLRLFGLRNLDDLPRPQDTQRM